MKTRTILLSLLLSATALALAPTAQAGIPEHCPEKTWTQTADSRHTVAVHSDCTMDVTLFEGIICLGGAVGVRDEQLGPVHVVQYYCRSPNEQPPLEITAAALDTCPEYDIQGGVLFDVRTDNVLGHCHVWVGLVDAYRICGSLAGVSHQQVREDVTASGATGQPRTLHVVVNYCLPIVECTCPPTEILALSPPIYCVMAPCGPGPLPSACALEAATPDQLPVLGPLVDPRTIVWGSDTGCDVDAATPSMDCAPPSSTGIDQTISFVHVHGAVCDGGIPDRIGPILA